MDLDISQAFERLTPEVCNGALLEHESRTHPYYRRGALGVRAAYYGGSPYAASTNDGHPWYAMRAYHQDGPWYGYSGWDDYATRNAIGCTPGTLVKGENGLMYRC
jgi:hypothetical protein